MNYETVPYDLEENLSLHVNYCKKKPPQLNVKDNLVMLFWNKFSQPRDLIFCANWIVEI